MAITLVGLSNSDFDLDSRVDVNGRSDLSDNFRGRVQVDETLVDLHLEPVVGVCTFTTRGLADSELQHLGGHADGALAHQTLLLSALDEVGAYLLDGLHISAGQSNADFVHLVLGGIIRAGFLQSGSHSYAGEAWLSISFN